MKPFRFGVGATALAADSRNWPDQARRLEGLGYSVLTVGDHPSMNGAGPFTALAAAACSTTTVRIGSYMLANDFRHPVQVAREFATLDQVSGGRVELGVGAGWLETDYSVLGVAFDPANRRIARLDEALQIIKRCFAGEPFSFDGDHYRLQAVQGFPVPVQRPHPPIVVGGGGAAMLRLAARHADVVALTERFHRGSAHLEVPSIGTSTSTATRAKIATIARAAGPRLAQIELGVLVQRVVVTDDPDAAAVEIATSMGCTPREVVESPNYLIGSHLRIIDRLEQQRATMGISYITVVSRDAESFAPVVTALAGR